MSSITTALLTLCFVAGKSGGHMLPCITQAEKILYTQHASKIYLFSSGTDLDSKIMDKHQKIEHYIPACLDSIPYKTPWLFPQFIYNLAAYFLNSTYKLSIIKPKKIISFGGLNSIPVCLAGKLLGIPFDVYELNVEPGQSIKFLSCFTDTIHICFSQTAQYFQHKKCVVTPYPIRFNQEDRIYNKEELLKKFNLSCDKKTIVILGGSQGSVFINQAIKSCMMNKDLAEKVQIIHQTGMHDQDGYKEFYEKNNIPAVVFAYNEQLQNVYNLADLVICRAGAGTLFEVNFFGKRCIIIPLQTDLNDHQLQNAYAMQNMHPESFNVVLQNDNIETLEQAIISSLDL